MRCVSLIIEARPLNRCHDSSLPPHERCRSLMSILRIIMLSIHDLLYEIENGRQELPWVKAFSLTIIRTKNLYFFSEFNKIKIQAIVVENFC